jgi:hypothetical protein
VYVGGVIGEATVEQLESDSSMPNSGWRDGMSEVLALTSPTEEGN